jgi:nucleotide-binding universal stress UspA family protein
MALTTLLAFHSADEPLDRVKPVIAMASDMGVHLNLVVFGVLVAIPTAAYPGMPITLTAEDYRQSAHEAEQRARTLETMVAESNVSARIMVDCVDRGMIGRTMSRHALCADVTIFPNGSVPKQDLVTQAFNGVLFDANRPVLILGDGDNSLVKVKKVLIAWNGEPAAASAIHNSLSLFDETVDLHIVSVQHTNETSGKPVDEEMQRFLERHGKKVTMESLDDQPDAVANLLLTRADEIGADMLVMGAYGHSRLREWLLGGTTRTLLSKTKLPVFMAH